MLQVAYFTHSGNTRVVADMIAAKTGGSLFRIEAVAAYPRTYEAVVEAAKNELRAGARPELRATTLPEGCRTLFLGYPNWWATMPMPVFAFLERNDLDGVVVAPFCTHEGSGMGRSLQDIRRVCPGATVVEGLAIRGSQAHSADKAVLRWLETIGVATLRSVR